MRKLHLIPPQQNGIAERKNRTLKEMMNAMLISSGLPDQMWGEAVLSACYILNKVPNSALCAFIYCVLCLFFIRTTINLMSESTSVLCVVNFQSFFGALMITVFECNS